MYCIGKQLTTRPTKALVGFDVEWTKNYKIKHGSQPFCFSFVWLDIDRSERDFSDQIEFGLSARYVQDSSEIPTLIQEADSALCQLVDQFEEIIVVGHQFSSDLGVLLQHPDAGQVPNLRRLKDAWSERREPGLFSSRTIQVLDTRYDLETILTKKSRRLVDVCDELGLEVTQPEIRGSMTKMQRSFYETGDSSILQRLLVLNIRHSLSSAILYLFSLKGRPPYPYVNTNRILYKNLNAELDYLRCEGFRSLL